MTEEYKQRRERLREALVASKLDALIISGPPSVRYLTGFTGSNAMVLVPAGGEAVLLTDPRYEIQAAQDVSCRVSVVKTPLPKAVMSVARRKRLHRLGFESGRLTFADYEALRECLWLGASLEPAAGIVEKLRMVKSAVEVEAIRRSMQTAAEAYKQAMRRVRAGMLESDLAAELDHQMRRLGAEKPAFETIVLAGERTALPHARPGPYPLIANRLLLVDAGAVQSGYASDMTRMAFLGTPGRRVRRLYKAVLEAQQAALSAVGPGILAGAVDQAARQVLRNYGLEQAFVHATGHGVGLEIHEMPRLGKREKTRLAAGMVVTVEPGAYIEGFGGIRIEDTVVVTSNGCEVLTPASRELLPL